MILNEIIQAICPLQVVGCTNDLQLDIRHLLTDSRQIGNEPEATLFFALKTDKNDGAKYIPQLISITLTTNRNNFSSTMLTLKCQLCSEENYTRKMQK